MAPGRGQPDSVLAPGEQEARPDPLAALGVAVEHVHRHRLAGLDPLAGLRELGLARITKRALPEADVAHRNVEVAREAAEILERRRGGGSAEDPLGVEEPAVQDGDPGAHLAQRDRQPDGLLACLDGGPASRRREPLAVGEMDLLHPVLEAREHQDGPELGEQGALGDPRRPICRTDGGKRRAGQRQSSARGGER